jgi:Zn-dependent oligopeptidase
MAPTFENTLVALERSGRTLDRVAKVFDIYVASRSKGPGICGSG